MHPASYAHEPCQQQQKGRDGENIDELDGLAEAVDVIVQLALDPPELLPKFDLFG
jgi:hypothetical protein